MKKYARFLLLFAAIGAFSFGSYAQTTFESGEVLIREGDDKKFCDKTTPYTSSITLPLFNTCIPVADAPNGTAGESIATEKCKTTIANDNGRTISGKPAYGCPECPEGSTGCEVLIDSIKNDAGHYGATYVNIVNNQYCYTCPSGAFTISYKCDGCDIAKIGDFGDPTPEGEGATPALADPLETAIVNMYPNPTSGNLNIDFDGVADYGAVKIVITNIMGSVVHQSVQNDVSSGHQTFQLNLGDLTSGVYNVALYSGSERLDAKHLSVVK